MRERAQIVLEPELKRRGQAKAAALGITFAEYLRRLITSDLADARSKPDISAIFDLGASRTPTNVARDKEKMIGEAAWEEDLRSIGWKSRRRAPTRG
jgi:hypothetical protein